MSASTLLWSPLLPALIDSSFKLSLSLTYPGGEVELQSLPRCFSSRSLTHSEPVSAFLLSIRTLGGPGHQSMQVHPYLLHILGSGGTLRSELLAVVTAASCVKASSQGASVFSQRRNTNAFRPSCLWAAVAMRLKTSINLKNICLNSLFFNGLRWRSQNENNINVDKCLSPCARLSCLKWRFSVLTFYCWCN